MVVLALMLAHTCGRYAAGGLVLLVLAGAAPGAWAQALNTLPTAVPDSARLTAPPAAAEAPILRTPSLPDGTVWRTRADLSFPRVALVGGAIGYAGYQHVTAVAADWYDGDQSRSFFFQEVPSDWRSYKQMDKLGHMAMTHISAHTLSQAFRWTGFSARQSIWMGGLLAYAYELQVELADGFFETWGFSVLDLAANTVGGGYAMLQQFYPETLGGVRLKWSYQPTDALERATINWYDDYDGMIFWLAVTPYDVLPGRVGAEMPGWLRPFGLAVGYGAENVRPGQRAYREIYLALDVDLTKVPTGRSRLLEFLMFDLNFIHLPLPGVRFSPDGVAYGFFF